MDMMHLARKHNPQNMLWPAGKKEVGHIVLANGGRLKHKTATQAQQRDSALHWVSKSQNKPPNHLARSNSSIIKRQEAQGYAFVRDENARLLDELASKEDHNAERQAYIGTKDEF